MQTLIANIKTGNELDAAQVAGAAEDLLSESVANDEKAEFLSTLADKGETPAEIAASHAAGGPDRRSPVPVRSYGVRSYLRPAWPPSSDFPYR